jgi:2-amino-4-hydroxy-6-hydroxymethyldihydropteridine diphosphokinase
MPRVFLSVGSNMGDRLQSMREAVARLRALADVVFVDASPLYQTEPWEQRPGEVPDPESWFFNCVVAIDTTLPARELLAAVQAIEDSLGRVRGDGHARERALRAAPARHRHSSLRRRGHRGVRRAPRAASPHARARVRAAAPRRPGPDIEHPILYQTIRELVAALEDEHEVRPSDLPRRWFER